ncbi:MAG: hypothetical protein LBC64_01235 [Fibromonadaceae bacterium]|jgi:hypothetical protein|nr:hypothetical protein [Fibromonadaceae bacterium]
MFMVNGIKSPQNEFFVAETGVKRDPSDSVGFAKTQENTDGYELSLSNEGWKALDSKGDRSEKGDKGEKNDKDDKKERDISGKEKLSEEDQRKVDELEKIDKKVRIHEQAHLNAAGGYAKGGANYDYVTGPDGKRYANGGHVSIDTSPEKTPEATIRKADIVRKAALAPADPSPADRQIAADATKMKLDAQKDLETAATSDSK